MSAIKASDADLERVTGQLLLSMHDLRTILSRKKNRAGREQALRITPSQTVKPQPK